MFAESIEGEEWALAKDRCDEPPLQLREFSLFSVRFSWFWRS